jgi:hypothetical protein
MATFLCGACLPEDQDPNRDIGPATPQAGAETAPAIAPDAGPDPGPGIAAPARDGNIAIQEEFDAAQAAGTVAAWELFIARHPDHPLIPEAERRLAALRSGDDRP